MESLTEFLRAKHFPYVVRKKVRYFYAHRAFNPPVRRGAHPPAEILVLDGTHTHQPVPGSLPG